MKRLVVILSMVFVCTALMANNDGDYICTNEGTFFFKKVKVNFVSNFIGVKSNGEKVKFNRSEVTAYSISGEIYEKMPVYKNNKEIGEVDFMKVVSYRNSMKLYEYEYTSENTGKKSRRYYVFKGDKFVVEIDNVNRGSVASFFDAE